MTDKEKAEMHDHWKDYYEPLSRIYREVKKGMPDFREMEYTSSDIIQDDEVLPELNNLIQIMLNDD